MRKKILLTLLFLAALKCFAQSRADSLRLQLATAKDDTTRCLLLSKLSRTYLFSSPDTAMKLAQQAWLLSKKANDPKGEASALRAIGNVYDITGDYPKSLQNFLRSLEINDSIRYEAGISADFGDLGIVYSDEGDERTSIEYTLKAKTLDAAAHNEKRYEVDLLNAGDSYDKLNVLDSAREFTLQCYEQALRLHDEENAGIALNNLGNIYSKMQDDASALFYYRQSIPYSKRTNNAYCFCETTMGMANVFLRAKKYDSSLHYARLAITAARQGGFTDRILEASNFLTSFFQAHKNIDSAFAYQQISIAAKDSLFSTEKIKQIQNLSFVEQQRQEEIAEGKLLAAARYKRNLQLAGIAVFIPTFLLFVLLLSRSKTKSRTVEYLGLLGLLLSFEFITLLIEPYIENVTNDAPVFMLLGLVVLASVLIPLHHRTEHWMKNRLVHKRSPQPA